MLLLSCAAIGVHCMVAMAWYRILRRRLCRVLIELRHGGDSSKAIWRSSLRMAALISRAEGNLPRYQAMLTVASLMASGDVYGCILLRHLSFALARRRI